MSLVGPRPDPTDALPYYRAEERRKFLVRPGITGLAQVAGRNDIPWRQRLEYDLEYIEHRSMWLDFRIALYTILEFIPPLRARRFQIQTDVSEQKAESVEGIKIAFEQIEESR